MHKYKVLTTYFNPLLRAELFQAGELICSTTSLDEDVASKHLEKIAATEKAPATENTTAKKSKQL